MAIGCMPERPFLSDSVEGRLARQVLTLRLGIEKILASDETETEQIMLDLRKLLNESGEP